jgi:hypothetical protein
METKRNSSFPFSSALGTKHNRVDPCFMTGKGCVYTEVIEEGLRGREDQSVLLGFSIMPFRPNLNTFFRNCLSEYFKANFQDRVKLQRADEVRRPGVIVCEGICKRIQESDFVTCDISLPNPNVFYELGLSYGIGHKIVVIYHDGSEFGAKMSEALKSIGCRSFAYHALDPLRIEDFDNPKYVWHDNRTSDLLGADKSRILLYEHYFSNPVPNSDSSVKGESKDIWFDFATHVKSAIGLAIQDFCDDLNFCPLKQPVVRRHLETIKGFKDVELVKVDANLKEIRDQVDSAYCMIIRTGFKECHPMAYFWLGYGHAHGKNVVPVTQMADREEKIEDLAFDIRAQRHMFFMETSPDKFEAELRSSLNQMILGDFAEWSRKQFWDKMLGKRGEVSIFTGALHNDAFGREMIGDWDLRAASELTSYFARAQYRAKIESPVYTPEYPVRKESETFAIYIESLKRMMVDKNCVLVASPDVNPLTEIMLGHMYQVPFDLLFKESKDIQRYPNAIVAVKERTANPQLTALAAPSRFFYKEIASAQNEQRRGFESSQIIAGRVIERFVSQTAEKRESFHVIGHLAIIRNPFRSEGSSSNKFIIVLNGVSGPATFALTHVLTGGVTKEFVAYKDSFSPEAESESILAEILEKTSIDKFDYLDCLVTVEVGPSDKEEMTSPFASDWRRILAWSINTNARQAPLKVSP